MNFSLEITGPVDVFGDGWLESACITRHSAEVDGWVNSEASRST